MDVSSTARPMPSNTLNISSDHDQAPLELNMHQNRHNTDLQEVENPATSRKVSVDAYDEARALIRLIQCRACSKILQQPFTLPCGETLCRACLPKAHQRENISYPPEPERQQGFACPFKECTRQEHAVVDCGLDITLSRVLDSIARLIERNPSSNYTQMLLEEVATEVIDGQDNHKQHLSGGRLAATYAFAQTGQLDKDADVRYTIMNADAEVIKQIDYDLLQEVMELVRPDLECQVCYNLLLDPITTSCGHTFCRTCVERVLDHSNSCPVCRRTLPAFRSLSLQKSNKQMSKILQSLCAEVLEQRIAIERQVDFGSSDVTMPLFVCTISMPTMPMFIHIFEPRYRLMVRRAMDSPSRSFGMVDHKRHNNDLGDDEGFQAPFVQYGVMLYIAGIQILPDGRSLIEAVGTTRFKVLSWGDRDGYTVAKVERINDIPTPDEEAMEAIDRTLNASPESTIPEWTRLPTSELLQVGLDFVATMRQSSAGWFHDRILRTYGLPPQDPATFPYWLATLLPVDDDDKYLLLRSCSVRERLKIVVGWIKMIEQRHWFSQVSRASCCIS